MVRIGRNRIWLRIGIGILLAMTVFLAGGTLAGLIGIAGNESNIAYCRRIEPMRTRYAAPVETADGNWEVVADGDYKILQLTDVHFGGGVLSIAQDRATIDDIVRLVRHAEPDLIVCTGDIAFPFVYASGTSDNMASHRLFAALMGALGVPWAVTLGNHDSESIAMHDRAQVSEFYARQAGSLFRKGNVSGYGNYALTVRNRDGGIQQKLIMMDSNDYLDNGKLLENYFEYDVIHDDQIDWYRAQVQDCAGKSMVFFHIPLVEFKTANELWEQSGDSDEVAWISGKRDEGTWPGYKNNGFFETMREIGHTQAVFCGHDHRNSAIVRYRGIVLAYGMALDRVAYPGIALQDAYRGATLITAHSDASFDLEQISVRALR